MPSSPGASITCTFGSWQGHTTATCTAATPNSCQGHPLPSTPGGQWSQVNTAFQINAMTTLTCESGYTQTPPGSLQARCTATGWVGATSATCTPPVVAQGPLCDFNFDLASQSANLNGGHWE